MFASGFLTRGSLGVKRYVVCPAIQYAIVGKALFSRQNRGFPICVSAFQNERTVSIELDLFKLRIAGGLHRA
jgi:hypothetical protein